MARTHMRRAAVLFGMIGSLSAGFWNGHGHGFKSTAHAGEYSNAHREAPRFEPPLHMPPTSDYLQEGPAKKSGTARTGSSFDSAALFHDVPGHDASNNRDAHVFQEDIEEAIEIPQAIEERLLSSQPVDPELNDLTGCDLTDKLCISSGSANRGRLINGISFPEMSGIQIRAGKGAIYGTPETIAAIRYAVTQVQKNFPETPNLVLGDISRMNGGRFSPHVSHQSGRDVDLGFYHTVPVQEFISANSANLDLPRTWTLLEALMEDHKVEYIFVDSYVQSLLYRYVKYELQAPQAYLEQVFSYGGSRRAIIRHAPGHRNHIHARFWSPIAVAAGMGLDLRPAATESFDYVALDSFKRGAYVPRDQFERADWSQEPLEADDAADQEAVATTVTWKKTRVTHRVRSGDTLSSVARRYHVDTDDVARWNRMSTRSILRSGQRLVIEQRVKVEVPVAVPEAVVTRAAAASSANGAEPRAGQLGTAALETLRDHTTERATPEQGEVVTTAAREDRSNTAEEASTVLDVMYVSQDDVQAAFKRTAASASDVPAESDGQSVVATVQSASTGQSAGSGQVGGASQSAGAGTRGGDTSLNSFSHIPSQLEASVVIAAQGDALRDETAAPSATGSKAAARARAASERSAKASTRTVQRFTYARVGQGDNLWKLARAHDTTVDALLKLNGLSRNATLKPGQSLKVKGWEEQVPASTGSARRGR